jgi:prepilin-type N-terminal cleavage/methylation domain-containing protein
MARAWSCGIPRRLERDQRGYTIVELLVVMIVIGLLAAIAYAVFLGQRTKAKDAEAKDNVAALVVDVESCRADSENFTACDTKSEIDDNGLPIDTGASLASGCSSVPDSGPAPVTPPDKGTVAVINSASDCYVAMAQTDDGHFFWLWRPPGKPAERACTPAGQGACHDDPASPDPTVGIWSAASS